MDPNAATFVPRAAITSSGSDSIVSMNASEPSIPRKKKRSTKKRTEKCVDVNHSEASDVRPKQRTNGKRGGKGQAVNRAPQNKARSEALKEAILTRREPQKPAPAPPMKENHQRGEGLKEAMLTRREPAVARQPGGDPTGHLNWWRHLTADDPITLDPLRNLPYEPFELSPDKSIKLFFDGKVSVTHPLFTHKLIHYLFQQILASYLVSSAKFFHPVSRRPLERVECTRLDAYLRRNRLGRPCVTRVFDDKDKASSEVADMRTEAQIIMDGLFGRPGAAPQAPPPMVGHSAQHSTGEMGWRMVDDDEIRAEEAAIHTVEQAWPGLGEPPESREEDPTGSVMWRPQLAAPRGDSVERGHNPSRRGGPDSQDHNPASIYRAAPEGQVVAMSVAQSIGGLRSRQRVPSRGVRDGVVKDKNRREPRGYHPREAATACQVDGAVMMPGSKGSRSTRQKEAKAVVWCDGMGWIAVPTGRDRDTLDEPTPQASTRAVRNACRAAHAPVPKPVGSAWPAKRSGMVVAKVSLRSVKENSNSGGEAQASAETAEADQTDAQEWNDLANLVALQDMSVKQGQGTTTDDEWENLSDPGSVVSDASYCLI